ncbi:hypothetical protein [Streptomyces sp. V4I2]|uniref:hypothetical protein n=1 Tax=Streptomyces sp. V4I2 TaxID=3042280 RepID=UPI00278B261A|nr:hypothetical protein [Streptomyces sp. V4I2]MDQ1051978.1 hypothetical protein [Streptomyces sp. V4I2]
MGIFINYRNGDQPSEISYGKTVEAGLVLWQLLQSADDAEPLDATDVLATEAELEERLAALDEVRIEPLPDDIESLSDSSRFLRDRNPQVSAPDALKPVTVKPSHRGAQRGFFLDPARVFGNLLRERREASWVWCAELDVHDPHAVVQAALSSAQEFITGTSRSKLPYLDVRDDRHASKAWSDHSLWLVPWRQDEGLPRKVRADRQREALQACGACREQRPYLFVIFAGQFGELDTHRTQPVTSWLDCSGPSVREVPTPDAIRGHGAIVVNWACDWERDQNAALRIAAMQLPANLYPVNVHSEEIRRSWEEVWRPWILQFAHQPD